MYLFILCTFFTGLRVTQLASVMVTSVGVTLRNNLPHLSTLESRVQGGRDIPKQNDDGKGSRGVTDRVSSTGYVCTVCLFLYPFTLPHYPS